MISWLPLVLFFPLVSALPLDEQAAQTVCGKFDSIPSGSYSLLSNLWGEAAASGSQCATLTGTNGNTVSWSTEWEWVGGGIKSFANLQLNDGINKQLSAINSMPSTWHWHQKGRSNERIVSDVAYDLFTSYSPGGSNVNEVMVWLYHSNAQPISYEYDESGIPLPLEPNINLVGRTWNLFLGSNDYNQVYSFLPASGHVSAFNADVYDFLKYLIDSGHISSSEYLTTAQAGTEATSGSAILTTSAYSLTIN